MASRSHSSLVEALRAKLQVDRPGHDCGCSGTNTPTHVAPCSSCAQPGKRSGLATLARETASRVDVLRPSPERLDVERSRVPGLVREPVHVEQHLPTPAFATDPALSLRRYGASAGPQGPAGLSAVIARVDAQILTRDATATVAATQAMSAESKVKARAFAVATGVDDPTSHRWWEIEAAFRRGTTGNATASGSASTIGGQEGANAGNWSAALQANASGGIEVAVAGSASAEVNWSVALLTEVLALDCFCSYRTLVVGGGALSGGLVSGQACKSIQRGSSFLSKYFRFSAQPGQTVTIDMSGLATFDTYLYLLKGADKYGALLAQDDDAGPGTDSQIIYTIGPTDGTQFALDCTSYGAGAIGNFSIQVA